MADNFNSSDDEVISAINITPLVDVVLVLLIIFLITAPVIYQAAIKVHLAKASTGETTDTQQLTLSLSRSGELTWDNEPIDSKGLEERLKGLGEKIQSKTAVINADRETPHGTVIELVDTLRRQGLTHLSFRVEKTATSQVKK